MVSLWGVTIKQNDLLLFLQDFGITTGLLEFFCTYVCQFSFLPGFSFPRFYDKNQGFPYSKEV